MVEEVRHYQVNGRYKIQFERSATKGVIGYKVEANGDDIGDVETDADTLRMFAENHTPAPEVEIKKEK